MAESLDTLVADSDRTAAAGELRQHHDSGRRSTGTPRHPVVPLTLPVVSRESAISCPLA